MSELNIMKLNITMNFLKIASIWGASILMVFKMGVVYQDFKTKMDIITVTAQDVKELKDWRREVTAYYLPQKAKQSNENDK